MPKKFYWIDPWTKVNISRLLSRVLDGKIWIPDVFLCARLPFPEWHFLECHFPECMCTNHNAILTPDVTLTPPTPTHCLCSGGDSYYDRYNKICYFDQKGLISSLFSLKQVPRPLFVTLVTFSTNFTHLTPLKLNKCHQFLSISYWSKQWVLVSIRLLEW